MKAAALLLAVLMLCGPEANAADPLAGRYEVRGWVPGLPLSGPPGYRGTMVLTAAAGYYQAQWDLGPDDKPSGVGLADVEHGVLAIAFQAARGPHYGLVLYHIRPYGVLEGRFVEGQGTEVGSDIARRDEPLPAPSVEPTVGPDSDALMGMYRGTDVLETRALGDTVQGRWEREGHELRGFGLYDVPTACLAMATHDADRRLCLAMYRAEAGVLSARWVARGVDAIVTDRLLQVR